MAVNHGEPARVADGRVADLESVAAGHAAHLRRATSPLRSLGTGKRLFPDRTPLTRFRLVDSKPTTAGVLILTYEPETPGA